MADEIDNLRSELERFERNRARLEEVERDVIALGLFGLKAKIRTKTLTWDDVIAARSLEELGVDISWMLAIAHADENSNLVSVAEVAEFALTTEGEF